MRSASRAVISSQAGLHPRLAPVVGRHLAHPDRRPVAQHTARAWDALRRVLREHPDRPLILDAGCGTGESTHRLAARHPAAWVIGVDKSAHRLGVPHGATLRRVGERILFARAELGDLYRCLAASRIRLGAHYLLYPNPWPKPGHLLRRWHGHPAFPSLLALGGRLEVRSNWRPYVDELAVAVRLATGATAAVRVHRPGPAPSSPFERKYAHSGQTLYVWTACLRPPRTGPGGVSSSVRPG